MKNQEYITQLKEENKSPVINPKEMETCELPNKKFKIIVFLKAQL